MMTVKIAEIPIQISCQDTVFFNNRLNAYKIGAGGELFRASMSIKSSACDEVILPDGEIIEKISAVTLAKMPDGRYYYYSKNRDGKVLCCTAYDPDYADVEIRQFAFRRHPVFSLTDFEYMYTGLAFSNRLAVEGGLVLHSSALSYKGKGIAFSAISGTGKSTHTGLWKKYLGNDVEIINDDKPAVRFIDGQPFLYGTPWSGKTDLNNNIRAPLTAIVFLQQASENSIQRISMSEAYYELSNEVARPSCDEALGIRLLDTMEKLLTSVPIYKLCCNISREAVQTVYEELIGGEMP